MDQDEKKWVEQAIEKCDEATKKSCLILFYRGQDYNDGADVIVTNAGTPELLTALAELVRAEQGGDSGVQQDS